MSDQPRGPGWWMASDGRWYPPESHPANRAPAAPPTAQPTSPSASPPSAHDGRRSKVVGLSVVLAVLVVAAIVVGGMVLSRDGSDTAGATEVLLEPLSSAGPDPFTASTTLIEVSERPSTLASVPPAIEDGEEVDGGVTLVGTTPGLYGGTRDETACDAAALVEFLAGDPAKAGAWAGAIGIGPDGVAAYVSALAPAVLTADTLVTNHGFRDGEAVPRQAVLERGTAVLVDATGTPRVRCSCGNPLAPPAVTVADARFTGPSWDGFEGSTTVTVGPGSQVGDLTLTDLSGGDAFTVPVGDGTTSTTTGNDRPTTTEPSDTELVLRASGIGSVGFGAGRADTMAVLSAALGSPTASTEQAFTGYPADPDGVARDDCSAWFGQEGPSDRWWRQAVWPAAEAEPGVMGGLVVYFDTGDRFVGWLVRGQPETAPLVTVDGIGADATVADAEAAGVTLSSRPNDFDETVTNLEGTSPDGIDVLAYDSGEGAATPIEMTAGTAYSCGE